MPEHETPASNKSSQRVIKNGVKKPAERNDKEKPAGRLIEIMGRQKITALAVGAVIGATLLCLLGIFRSTMVPTDFSRFFLCLLTAFLFAVFVFTIYPADYKLDIGKKIQIPFVLVGPGALWIALFLFLWYMLPNEGAVGKAFLPVPGAKNIPYSGSWASNWEPAQPKAFYKFNAGNPNDPDAPAGFYIEFDRANDEFQAVIGVGPSQDEIEEQHKVKFSRAAATYQLQGP